MMETQVNLQKSLYDVKQAVVALTSGRKAPEEAKSNTVLPFSGE